MDKFQSSLPMMLQRTFDAIIPLYREVFRQHKISEQQWRILRVLWETDNCTTFELSSKTLLSAPSMVGVIDRMIKRGLVVRVRSNEDRRKVFVKLTKKGSALQAELTPQIDAVYQQIVSRCDKRSWRIMIETMQQIIDAEQSAKQQLEALER